MSSFVPPLSRFVATWLVVAAVAVLGWVLLCAHLAQIGPPPDSLSASTDRR